MKVTAANSANNFLQADDEKAKAILAEFMEQVAFILNGNTDVLDNLKLQTHRVVFTGIAQDFDIRHNLGRVARGYFVIRKSGNFNIYDGSNDWTANSVFLRSSAVGSATVLIF